MPTLRRATLDDLDLLVSHRQRMWQAMGRFTAAQHNEASRTYRRWLRPRLRSGRATAFIVEGRGKQPVASGVVWLQEFQPRPTWGGTHQAYLMSVFTEPAARGRGHATRITRAAMAWAKEEGAERMALHASAQGARIYRRLGFERTHEMRITL
jgi:RimJ/RimL family protein N-acetyltransferase